MTLNQPTTPDNPEKNTHSGNSAAPGAAIEHEHIRIDPELQAVIECWDNLSDAVKTGLLAIVRACGG